MSDISADENHAGPYETKPTTDGKGIGAFATRDIEPGEIILVDFTSIIYNSGTTDEECDQMVTLYEALEQDQKDEWGRLAQYVHDARWERIHGSFSRLNPDGTILYGDQSYLYTERKIQLMSNDFGIDDDPRSSRGALFLKAARFNHSCDPNGDYIIREGRWVLRANRSIKEGEEILISYVPRYDPTEDRQVQIQGWGFVCKCGKCEDGIDEYTASLEEARDLAIGVKPKRRCRNYIEPEFHDSIEGTERTLFRRRDLLRELHEKTQAADKKVSYQKELVFILWDISNFNLTIMSDVRERKEARDENGNYREAYLGPLRQGTLHLEEGVRRARTVWPETHQMVSILRKDLHMFQTRYTPRAMRAKKPQVNEGPGPQANEG